MAERARAFRTRFIAGSLAFHALLVGLVATQRKATPSALEVRPPSSLELELELDSELVVREPAAALAPPEPRAAAIPRVGGGGERRLARVTPEASDLSTESEADAEAGGEAGSESVASASADPGLSLSQLGVEGPNPFIDRGDPAKARAAKAQAVKRRLDRALAQGLTNADVERGRGAHGHVLRSLEAVVYASNAPLNGDASFVFVFDGDGTLRSATLGRASGDRAAWLRVAHQTAKALAGKNPGVRKGQGVKLTLAVSSHLELPSGADPGLELSLQGAPLKKGGGPRSTRLDLSIFPFPAATLAGDPADLGARPRRMVRSHVVSEELL